MKRIIIYLLLIVASIGCKKDDLPTRTSAGDWVLVDAQLYIKRCILTHFSLTKISLKREFYNSLGDLSKIRKPKRKSVNEIEKFIHY